MLKTAPDPIDVQDFQFKLHCRLKVFENDSTTFSRHCSLVTCASRFGLIFVGTNSPIVQVIQLKEVEKYTKNSRDQSDYYRRNLTLASPPSHLSVNSEHTVLAIVTEKNNCSYAIFYDVKSFWRKELLQLGEVRLSLDPTVFVTEVNWNPALSFVFTACKSDGSLGVYELKNPGVEINELPAAATATCFSWSPKGKQIAVGSRDGKITQLKPDLKAVKVIKAPPLKEPHLLQSLQWISNYQYIGVFQPLNVGGPSVFIVIDAPKLGEAVYTNYDDICYNNGNLRPVQFYMFLLPTWNVLIAASSNSMEVGILGNLGENWTQWIMGDAARAELPLSVNHQETLPIGCALDVGCTQPLLWGESTLPPAPLLLLYSHHGVLCCYNIVNLKDGVSSICIEPELINETDGLQYFVRNTTEINDLLINESSLLQTPTTIQVANMELSRTVVTSNSLINNTLFKIQPSVTTFTQGVNNVKTQSAGTHKSQTTLTPILQERKSAQTPLTTQPHSLLSIKTDSEKDNVLTSCVQASISSNSVGSKTIVSDGLDLNQSEYNDYLYKSEIATIDLQADEEIEKVFSQMIKEECVFLESELKSILNQGQKINLNLQSDADKIKLVESTNSLETFFHEVSEICVTQSSEIHVLKQNLLQSWAWYEEVKSRHLASQNESMVLILRAQPLDSASEKQLADIQYINYYLESQISQAHLVLDEQWEHFQDYCKKTQKIQIPTMEIIFQTMVKQNAILRKQAYILKDIANRIRNKSRSATGPPLLITTDDFQRLPNELKRLRMNPEDICQIQYEHVAKRMKNFIKKRVDVLRFFLRKRECTHVSVVKPQLSTSIIQESPSSKLKHTDVLTPKLITTNPKELPPKKLEFLQSTPKQVFTKGDINTSSNLSTQTNGGLQNLVPKFETKNFSNLNEKPFTSLPKAVMTSSPHSAFVPASFGDNSSTSTSSLKLYEASSTETCVPLVLKTTPNIVLVTVASDTSVPKNSKLFSFMSCSESPLSLHDNSKSGSKCTNANVESISSSKTVPSTFNILNTQPTMSVAPNSFSKLPNTSLSGMIPKTSISNSAYGFATTSSVVPTSTFSFSTNSVSNIFGVNIKGESFLSEVTKPFDFSSRLATQVNTPVTSTLVATTSQTLNFGTSPASVIPTKGSGIVPSTSVTEQWKHTTLSASIVPTSFILSSTNVATLSDVVTPAQSSSLAVATSLQSVFTLGRMNSVFTTVTSVTQKSVPVTVTASDNKTEFVTVGTSPCISTPSVINATVSSTLNNQSMISTSSAFRSVITSSSTSDRSSTSTNILTPSFNFDNSSVNKLAVGSNNLSKPSLFGNVIIDSGTRDATVIESSKVSEIPSSSTSSFMASSISNTQPSLFGVSTSTRIFGTSTLSTTQVPIFGSSSSTLNTLGTTFTTQTSIFGATQTSDFGSASTSTTQSPFGITSATTGFGISTTPTIQSPIFGGSSFKATASSTEVSAASTSQAVFSSGNANQSPVFGSADTPTSLQPIFGNTCATTTSQSHKFGIFGDASQKSSIFSDTALHSSQSSIFGNSSQPSVFGTATCTNNVFSQNQTSTTFGQSLFGSSSNSFGSSSIFGAASPTFGHSSGSFFGNRPVSTSGTIFGGSATTGTTFSPSVSAFGTPTPSTQSSFSSTNVFPNNTTQAAVESFGFGSLSVRSTVTTSSSGFGSSTSNPFGTENKYIFGNSGTSGNSQFATNRGSSFGTTTQNFSGGFGSESSFGQQSTFNQSSFGNSTFGQIPSGPFSSGSNGSVGQSGFGTSSNFQKASGFACSPAFGGSPTFGTAPSFGGAPSFGNSPTFGGTSKMFGSANSGFGAVVTSQSTGFGNLANQPTVGFANLAQHAASGTPNAPFSGNSSFSSWR